MTAPLAALDGTPLEPYWNWNGLPFWSKAVPCSGPALIRPYLVY
jgi:hypothetical protein